MSAKTTAEMISVMEAYLHDADIQCRVGDGRWFSLSEDPSVEPSWDWAHRDYRVKPEPREWWMRTHISGAIYGRTDKLDSHLEQGRGWGPIVHVREVVDGEEA